MQPAQPLRLALVGNPNCGKTALFNRLTGARQKVANYAGVTVERKEGHFTSAASGRAFQVVDLPGAYSLNAMTPDEAITRDVLFGKQADEVLPDVIVLVADATNLKLNLRLVLEVLRLGRPTVLALNMMDVARKRGVVIDTARLQQELDIPVIETVAVKPGGGEALVAQLDRLAVEPQRARSAAGSRFNDGNGDKLEATQREVRRILDAVIRHEGQAHTANDRIDAVVLHPVLGYALLAAVLFLIFQAVFSWSEAPMNFIKESIAALGAIVNAQLPEGPARSLLVDGIIAGAGSVLVFLPQILVLFFFILILEESGYLPRAAFLLDRLMGSVGLSGRAFIPLLSSFACAIPGIMATRTIQNPRDRLATIMIAPLMTCSARLPVYALVIGAFIPDRTVGIFNLQGLVLFALYVTGIISAMAVAWIFNLAKGKGRYQPLMLELPNYHLPNLRNLAIGLWERARIFMTRVGTIILSMMILIWFLSSFPAAPEGATGAAIQYSLAGQIGHLLQPLFEPIGFNWQISIALIPGLAAREVAVGALGTVYALSATGEELATTLTPMIASTWSLPTALSLLAWYVFAPQCISTLSTVCRETGSWLPVLAMTAYMFTLAYLASFITFQVSRMLLGGA
ncbi:ferrous iron transporter B [Noviherbaspirillum denitrificans]|uniref:Fe(2+) transporter FeoB n=1 Tax=Noviherbaspirillum denitrificans TaxID=1968433 RepID=A0A254TPW8_9BURK|nr:ferrous iron transporter B [Noviherbaspirillum denitrificans]OWW21768.1 ferrous iron transporter B [Noviherbaspirillum denitrificans]